MLTKLFGFDPKTMTVKKEVMGGITTFLTMAYILAVNPSILSEAGMDSGAVFTVTVVASFFATLVMAIYAKLPFALAPGMGLNAFFAYTVCLTMGYTWQFALTAVFIEGIIFMLLTVTGLRQKIVEAMPLVLRRAISPGIGLFIAFIGLKNAGVIVDSPATLVTLGNVHDHGVLLALFGIVLTAVLLIRKITGALLIGILVTMIVGIPLGITHYTGILSTPPSMESVMLKFEWHNIFTVNMAICVLTFLFIDMFDTIGTVLGVCQRAGMVEEDGHIHGLKKAFMADAVGTTVGACLGTSTVTTYVENASGVEVGGRSGLTAFIAAVCFMLALFFSPLFLAIPSQATAPALILVGVMMMGGVQQIDFSNYIDAIPAFLCIAFMPLAYSISEGIMVGLVTYVVIRLCSGNWRQVSFSTLLLAIFFILRYWFL